MEHYKREVFATKEASELTQREEKSSQKDVAKVKGLEEKRESGKIAREITAQIY